MTERSAAPPASSASTRDPAYSSGPIVLVLAIILTISAIQKGGPPPAVGAGAPARDFSAARAMPDLRAIAARPHPLASSDEARVRGYLMKRLTKLGAAPEIETATAARQSPFGPRTFAIVNNIVARIPGTASTGAIMLVAHYDSVPSGPGAGDDSAAVAAILETIRALKSGPPLRNDLIVLLSDGEELGMLGAKAFVENYPGLRDVKVALNFEMRGDYGPVVMFQTSDDNAWLIRALAAAAPFPRTTSLASAIYHRMPNDTDLSVFLHAGLAGMNFAAIGGFTRYHTRLDNIANLDPRSMQHQGSYALSLAREFGAADLSTPPAGDEIYFTLGAFFRYPAGLAIALAIAAMLLLAGTLRSGVHRGRFSFGGVFTGFGIYAAVLLVAVAEGRSVFAIFTHLAAHQMLPFGATYGGAFLAAAAPLIVFATLCALYSVLARAVTRPNLAAGALLMWAVLAILSAAALPGGSYLLVWPLIFATLALSLRWRGAKSRDPIAAIAAALLAVIPCALMIAPVFAITGDGTALMVNFGAMLAALMFGILIPYLDLMSGNHERLLACALGAASVAMFVIGIRHGRFSDTQPRPDSIFYVLDAASERAVWVSVDRAPDRYTAQFFQHHVRAGSLALLTGETAPLDQNADWAGRQPPAGVSRFCMLNHGATIEGDAPAAEFSPPELNVIDDSTAAGVRTLTMHIASARHAPIIWIAIARGVKMLDSSIDGKSPGGASDGYAAWFWNVPEDGFDLTLKLADPGLVRINIIDQTIGLPSFPGIAISPRPADVMPAPFPFFDSTTLIRKTFILGGAPPIPNA
ncbi:MAG TPA: M20/M25/M40 family metallo-hydrolase [Candidatus Binataceae bacterium]|nr:M20/M25/M40 family metallo-hydrolase [Candidatus Binataceae bacterium]